AFGSPSAVLVNHCAVFLRGFFQGTRSTVRLKKDLYVRHRALKLAEGVALKVDVARVFGCEANNDGQALLKPCKRLGVGGRKGIAAILRCVCENMKLSRTGEEQSGRG